MNILVFGTGAVGLGLASCLIRTGHQVDLIGRAGTVTALRQHGLVQSGIFGEHRIASSEFFAADSLQDLPPKNYDFILVCTKSFDTQPAAQTLASAPFLIHDEPTRFVLCQNGWGNAEIFADFFPKERVKSARIITGFCRPQKHQVEITVHADAIHLGNLFGKEVDDLTDLSSAIDSGGIPCRVTSTISRDLWAKMLYNCMLNGLSTVFSLPYGLLGESSDTRELMQSIAREVFAVMQADGHDTHWPRVEDYLETFYKQQLPATYKHEPSMLQDIRAQKRTEIDALNGAIARLGNRHDVPVPHNTFVTHMIRFMESRI